MEGVKGENAPNWKRIVGKSQVHKWLDVNYGKLRTCEGNDCRKKSFTYEWCLKTGFKYERKRENFLRLCRSCHRRYDLTEEKKKQAIKNLWWKKGIKNLGKINYQNLWWLKDKKEMKEYYEKKRR
ncbi:MAG: hypothetical protein AABY22_35185 [Nanoarchaeota archaeon]